MSLSGDDSLADVEAYMAEVESFLRHDKGPPHTTSAGGRDTRTEEEQHTRHEEAQRGRTVPRAVAGAPSRPPAPPANPQWSALPPQPHTQTYSVHSDSSAASAPHSPYTSASASHSVHSSRSVAAPAALAAEHSYHATSVSRSHPSSHSHSYAGSGYSTPSTVSSASSVSGVSVHRAEPAPLHDDVLEHASASSRSARSTPSMRSSVPSSASAARERSGRHESGNNEALESEEERKHRTVQQLLQQRRQAQITGRANASLSGPDAASIDFAAAPAVVPAMLSTRVVPPPHIDRAARDQMVERLLQERRRQKEAAAREERGAAAVSQQPPGTTAAPAYHTSAHDHQRSNAIVGSSPKVPMSAQTAHYGHHRSPPPPSSFTSPSSSSISPSHSFDDRHDLSHDASASSNLSEQLSPGSSMRSGSNTSSPLDPRFRGHAQTIFEAAEYLNEDGTSIVHSTPTHRSHRQDEEEEEDEEREQQSQVDEHDDSRGYSDTHDGYVREDGRILGDNHSDARSPPSPRPSSFSTAQRFGNARRPHTARPAGERPRQAQSRSLSRTGRAHGKSAAGAPQRGHSAARGKRDPSAEPPTLRPATARAAAAPVAGSSTSRYSRAAVAAELERERAAECTFAPTLVSKPRASVVDDGSTLEDRLAVWQRRQAASVAKRLELQREYEEEKLQECTFAPAINPTSEAKAAALLARQRAPVTERLHHEADQRLIMREKARRSNEEELLSSLPFAPQISSARGGAAAAKSGAAGAPRAAATSSKPLYQRVGELQKRKNERLHAALLASRQAETHGAGFKPQLNPVSEKLAREKEAKERVKGKQAWEEAQRAQDVADDPSLGSAPAMLGARLSDSHAHSAVASKLRLAHAHAEASAEVYTFKPEVNAVSEKLLKQSRVFAGVAGADFLTRQERMQAIAREQAAERAAQEERLNPATFTPDIGNADAILQASKKRQAAAAARAAGAPHAEVAAAAAAPIPSESAAEKAERMSTLESRHLSLLKSKLKVLHSQQEGLTFKPELSAVSRRLAEERAAVVAAQGGPAADNDARRMAAELLAEQADAEFRAAHPFKPALSSVSQELVARGLVEPRYKARDAQALTAQIKEDAEERQQRLASIARAEEAKELAECTFEPSAAAATGRAVPLGQLPKAPRAPVLVRGMNRFMELKALHKRQAEERAAREAKVFLLGQRGAYSVNDVAVGYTVPQPFSLSHEQRYEQRAEQAARIKREAQERELGECTFAPVTSQKHNRQLIQQILHNDSFCQDGE